MKKTVKSVFQSRMKDEDEGRYQELVKKEMLNKLKDKINRNDPAVINTLKFILQEDEKAEVMKKAAKKKAAMEAAKKKKK